LSSYTHNYLYLYLLDSGYRTFNAPITESVDDLSLVCFQNITLLILILL